MRVYIGPTWLDMTPKTKGGDRYDAGPSVSLHRDVTLFRARWFPTTDSNKTLRMTLCGSEVPQDRWRGRTAGSGMWTRTENLLSWSPSGDSAIPYG